MFHVKQRHYIRTELAVPQAGTLIHVAELEEIDSLTCSMLRIVELAPGDIVTGAATPQSGVGTAPQPRSEVPHPDTYKQYLDITTTTLTPDEFESLWAEAQAKFPDLP